VNGKFKEILLKWLWPVMPGFPDDGRKIVQGPHLRALANRAVQDSKRFRRVYNAGAGEGGYSRFLLELPGVESLYESDFGWTSSRPPQIDPRQFYFCASLTGIPAPGRQFDLVLCTEVLEHVREDGQGLDELARTTAPGGWLLLTVPTPPAVPDSAHVREGYRPAELRAMLANRGFEIVETRFCMHFFFRFILLHWSRARWTPRFIIWALAFADRCFPIGPPMDLMMLARRTGERAAPIRAEANNLADLARAH
jgi:SAM-dependent methyltransferase